MDVGAITDKGAYVHKRELKMKSLVVAAVAALTLASCTGQGGSSSVTPVAAPAASSEVLVTARGGFVGTKKFKVTGTTEVFRRNKQWFIRLGPNFSESGAPDPKVALGNKAAGGYQPGTILGLIEANGESIYALTPGLDIGDYDQVWIWCEKFNVPIGHADLTIL